MVTVGHVWAVALAVVGAGLFGLAAVRQHTAVRATVTGTGRGVRHHLNALRQLLRHPGWLVGSVQGIVAGCMHVVALALAPITLIQPIGVLAVPVTVVATSIKRRQRPGWRQVAGALASVAGIAVLTVLLLTPTVQPLVLPPWWLVAAVVAVAVGLSVAALLSPARGPALLRCIVLASAAAVLFGLNSVLIRLTVHIVEGDMIGSQVPLLVTAALGFAIALPVGLWAMQSAYLSGSPHVVICCLTLLDPLAAVVGGDLLLQDGVAVTGMTLVAVGACVFVATLGVVLLSAEYPVELADPDSRYGDSQPRAGAKRERRQDDGHDPTRS